MSRIRSRLLKFPSRRYGTQLLCELAPAASPGHFPIKRTSVPRFAGVHRRERCGRKATVDSWPDGWLCGAQVASRPRRAASSLALAAAAA